MSSQSPYRGHRYPPEIISYAVWLYHRFTESADVIADDLVFSEMIVINDARMWITNSICEGQTIHLGALDDAVVYCKGGEIWSYVSTWGNATMILDDSLLDHTKAEYLYQYTNIAHQQSRLFAINTDFVSPAEDPSGALPRAVDGALVMVARLPDLTPAPVRGWMPIRGMDRCGAAEFDKFQAIHPGRATKGWFLLAPVPTGIRTRSKGTGSGLLEPIVDGFQGRNV